MEKQKLESLISTLTDNNKELLLHVVNLLLDEVAFSAKNQITLTLYGLVEIRKFDKALKYLKAKNIVINYKYLKNPNEVLFSPDPINWVTVFFDTDILRTFSSMAQDSSSISKQTKVYAGQIEYDDEHAIVTFKARTATLFTPEILEAFLFAKVHKADGARLNSIHLIEQYEDRYRSDDRLISNKSLTNAKDRINKKFESEFSIDNVIMYERSQFWLNHSYISENSPYKIV